MLDPIDKIAFIKMQYPDGAERLERLLGKKENLHKGNVYNERFTERQFFLVFTPLLEATLERARILEILSKGDDTITAISLKLGLEKQRVFTYLKELMRKNLVEIANNEGQDALFRKK